MNLQSRPTRPRATLNGPRAALASSKPAVVPLLSEARSRICQCWRCDAAPLRHRCPRCSRQLPEAASVGSGRRSSGSRSSDETRSDRDRALAFRLLGLPRFDQLVVVDSDSLRLFVGELTLGREIAILFCFRVPVFSSFFLVQLGAELALNARLLEACHDRILIARQSVHGLLRSRLAGDRLRYVLPPHLRQLAVFGHIDASWGP